MIDMDGKAYWYGGLLNWINLWATPRVELKCDDLEAAKRRFDQIVTGERDYQLISIYYHPCEFACEEFWDAVNFSDGKNPADGKLQSARTLFSRNDAPSSGDIKSLLGVYTYIR